MTRAATAKPDNAFDMDTASCLECALEYARSGFSVVPLYSVNHNGDCTCGAVSSCPTPGKHPRIDEWQKLATTVETTIRDWWRKWPTSNVGIRTGNGIFVIDIDPCKGGEESLTRLIAEYGPLPETLTDITGSGGHHLFFRGEGVLSHAPFRKDYPGLDTRGEGGLVVAPPSVTDKGAYQWDGIEGHKAPIANAPGWLMSWLTTTAPNGTGRERVLVTEVISEGGRNAHLIRVAGKLRGGGAEFTQINAFLQATNTACCKPPLSEREVEGIAKSASRYERGSGFEVDQQQATVVTPKQSEIYSPRGFKASELATMKPETTPELIEDLLPAEGAVVIHGPSKSNKTVLAVDMGFCIATGAPLFDYFKVLRQGPVMIIEQDEPDGIAKTIAPMVRQSRVKGVRECPFHVIDGKGMELGPELIAYLRREIQEHKLRYVVLDSYTSMRPKRGRNIDLVKQESEEFRMIDSLARELHCCIVMLHHVSKASAALDWDQQGAGSYAINQAVEAVIHTERFRALAGDAPERLVQSRGRHMKGLEMVLRFNVEHLCLDFVSKGGASSSYPEIQSLRAHFGQQVFTPKEARQALFWAPATGSRVLERLVHAGGALKIGFGQYKLLPE